MSCAALERWSLGAAAALAVFSVATSLSWSPDLADRLRDDAYYEFAWAANVAAGRGPTVSDGVTTSGVQLLWSTLLVPLAWLLGAGALPLVAPWLGVALHAVTAATWLAATANRRIGAALALCWFAHPLLLRECQNGQETALACLCAVQLWRARDGGVLRRVVWSGLAVFARSELLLLAVLLAARSVRRCGWRVLAAPALAGVLFVGVNLSLGGGPWPDSSLPMAWLWRANFAATAPGVLELLQQHWWYVRPVLLGGPWATVSTVGGAWAVFVLVRDVWPRRLRALPLVAVALVWSLGMHDLLVAAVVALLLALLPRRGLLLRTGALQALALALLAILAVHWAVRWYPRDYYLAPIVLLPFAAVLRARKVAWLPLLFVLGQWGDTLRFAGEPLQGQREMELAGRHLGAVLPAGERVGCFNSGIVTFLQDVLAVGGERRGVVNLDGVVDARTFAALRQRRLAAWLDEQDVRFVVDNAVQFALDPRLPHACGRWFDADFDPQRDLVEIARFDVPDVFALRAGADGLRLYWRVGRGAPPPAPPAQVLAAQDDGGCVVLVPMPAGQALLAEGADGVRRELARVDTTTALVVLVPRERRGTGRLFVGDASVPALLLPPL